MKIQRNNRKKFVRISGIFLCCFLMFYGFIHGKSLESEATINIEDTQPEETAKTDELLLENTKENKYKIVVIDAGHGGMDSGAISMDQSTYEKDINLKILLRLKELLEKEDIQVYYTRQEDVNLSPEQRAEFANEKKADLFLSIHCNSSDSGIHNGTWVLYDEEAAESGFSSKDFATIIQDEFVKVNDLKDGGIHPGHNIRIIRYANMPVALIELGFLSNQKDLAYLTQEKHYDKIVLGLYNGIKKGLKQIEQENGED